MRVPETPLELVAQTRRDPATRSARRAGMEGWGGTGSLLELQIGAMEHLRA